MNARVDDKVWTCRIGPLFIALDQPYDERRGFGPFIGHKKIEQMVAALDASELQDVNREAWKQRRKAERQANQFSNVTVYGNRLHDMASMHYDVCKAVCLATWKRMKGGA